jgi:hypothetical protein
MKPFLKQLLFLFFGVSLTACSQKKETMINQNPHITSDNIVEELNKQVKHYDKEIMYGFDFESKYCFFEVLVSAEGSITFGHGINYDEKGLYYRPKLGFDGLSAEYLVEISANLAIEIVKDKNKVKESRGGKHEIAKGTFKNVIPPFDVIEELEKLFGMSANIPLIKN